MNKPYFEVSWNIFLTDWRLKRLKNKIDLLLFYSEQFYVFSESESQPVLILWNPGSDKQRPSLNIVIRQGYGYGLNDILVCRIHQSPIPDF